MLNAKESKSEAVSRRASLKAYEEKEAEMQSKPHKTIKIKNIIKKQNENSLNSSGITEKIANNYKCMKFNRKSQDVKDIDSSQISEFNKNYSSKNSYEVRMRMTSNDNSYNFRQSWKSNSQDQSAPRVKRISKIKIKPSNAQKYLNLTINIDSESSKLRSSRVKEDQNTTEEPSAQIRKKLVTIKPDKRLQKVLLNNRFKQKVSAEEANPANSGQPLIWDYKTSFTGVTTKDKELNSKMDASKIIKRFDDPNKFETAKKDLSEFQDDKFNDDIEEDNILHDSEDDFDKFVKNAPAQVNQEKRNQIM